MKIIEGRLIDFEEIKAEVHFEALRKSSWATR